MTIIPHQATPAGVVAGTRPLSPGETLDASQAILNVTVLGGGSGPLPTAARRGLTYLLEWDGLPDSAAAVVRNILDSPPGEPLQPLHWRDAALLHIQRSHLPQVSEADVRQWMTAQIPTTLRGAGDLLAGSPYPTVGRLDIHHALRRAAIAWTMKPGRAHVLAMLAVDALVADLREGGDDWLTPWTARRPRQEAAEQMHAAADHIGGRGDAR